MQSYVGTKTLKAKPMTRGEYNAYRGWKTPHDEDPAEAGYLVEYTDGGKPNHHDHAGYISWSPKDVFEYTYRPTTGATFGLAVGAMKEGHFVTRAGWNGKQQFVYYVDSWEDPLGIIHRECFELKAVDGSVVPWAPSVSDALAEDWQLVCALDE